MAKFKAQLLSYAPTHFEYQLEIETKTPTSEYARWKFAETMNRAAELTALILDSDDENKH